VGPSSDKKMIFLGCHVQYNQKIQLYIAMLPKPFSLLVNSQSFLTWYPAEFVIVMTGDVRLRQATIFWS
jgi:hypothetical protein